MAFQENGVSHYSFVTDQNDYTEEPDNFYSCDKFPCSSTFSITPNESRKRSVTAHKQIHPDVVRSHPKYLEREEQTEVLV
jgi:hypothetical protein